MINIPEELKPMMVTIGSVTPHPRNPRIDHDVDAIAASITEFGWHSPLVAQRDGTLLIGHGRLYAARKLGLDSVPVVYVDDGEQVALARMVADNRLGELSSWDLAELESLVTDLPDLGDVVGALDLESIFPKVDDSVGANDESESLSTTYQIVVTLEKESDLDVLLEQLLKEGYSCQALIM